MPTESTYLFLSTRLFDGFCWVINEQKPTLSMSAGLHFQSINFKLVAARPDAEHVIDLGPVVNSLAAPQIVPLLGGHQAGGVHFNISLTSSIQAQIAPWIQVGYFWQRPNAHSVGNLFIRIHFDLHISTPWYMSDADADMSIYVLPGLKNHKVSAKVDGAWVKVHGGWPDGQQIADTLGDIAIQAIPRMQTAINSALQPLAAGNFNGLYLLPGNGTKSTALPKVLQDGTADTALAVF